MRRLGLLVTPALLWLVAATPAMAAAPTRERLDNADWSSSACGFEVDVHVTFQKEYLTTFTDSVGDVTKVVISGPVFATLTNVETEATRPVNISGPAVLNFVNGRLYANGPGIGSLAGIAFALGFGHVNLDTLEIDGHTLDVCQILAG